MHGLLARGLRLRLGGGARGRCLGVAVAQPCRLRGLGLAARRCPGPGRSRRCRQRPGTLRSKHRFKYTMTTWVYKQHCGCTSSTAPVLTNHATRSARNRDYVYHASDWATTTTAIKLSVWLTLDPNSSNTKMLPFSQLQYRDWTQPQFKQNKTMILSLSQPDSP